MERSKRPITDANKIIWKRYFEGHPERIKEFEQELLNCEIARIVYDLREELGLTHAQLAERVGATPSLIARLEDAHYPGDALSMLYNIASAFDRRIEIRFVPLEKSA